MQGYVDILTPDYLEGWVWNPANPEEAVSLQIVANGLVIGETTATLFRDDLRQAGIGNGDHAFRWAIPNGLLSDEILNRIEVKAQPDGWRVPGNDELLPDNVSKGASQLSGNVEVCDRHVVSGWVINSAQPKIPVSLEIFDGETLLATVLANRYRRDLVEAGIGDGFHAFQVRFPGGLSPLERHIIRVKRENDSSELTGSPAVIEPSNSFDSALEDAVAKAVDALALEHDQDRVLAFLAAQTQRLLQRHAEIDSHRAARIAYRERQLSHPAAANGDAPLLRALVIDDCIPDRARDAGSQALLSHILALKACGYAISFVATQDETASDSAISELSELNIKLCKTPFYSSPEEVLKWQRDCFDLIYLHRISNAEKYLALARHYNRRAKVLYSVADLHHVRVARQAEVEQRPELLKLSKQLRLAECVAAVRADAVLTHSSVEADLLHRLVPAARVFVVPWAVPIQKMFKPVSERHGVAFIAGFRHRPNPDAAWFFLKKVMPLVWETHPNLPCFLAGSHIPHMLEKQASQNVRVLGSVAHLGEVFEQIRLTVAPLRFGAGVKGKVLSSFAAGIPCVMTPMASEGLSLHEDLQMLVGNDAGELANVICTLHEDLDALTRMSELCQQFIQTQYSEASTTAALENAIEQR